MYILTIGGEEKIIDGTVYICRIKDLNRKIERFLAQGLDKITKLMECPLSIGQLKMFPNYRESHCLMGTERVNYLISISKAGWQPQRMVLAKGDMWMWQNQFSICIGGTHPWIMWNAWKHEEMYIVLHMIKVNWPRKDFFLTPTFNDNK